MSNDGSNNASIFFVAGSCVGMLVRLCSSSFFSSRFSQFLWKSNQQYSRCWEKTRSSRRMYQTHSSLVVCTTNTATYYAFFFSFAQTFILFHFRLREYPRTITPPQSALWKIDDEKSKKRSWSYSWERAARLYRASRLHQHRKSINNNNIIITETAPHESANRSLD